MPGREGYLQLLLEELCSRHAPHWPPVPGVS